MTPQADKEYRLTDADIKTFFILFVVSASNVFINAREGVHEVELVE
ncbi:hypothetical protein SIN8267_01546 [Sinobacterium norvegicum]|uniref:Uncharacterized protein n=1 Tax=Sinobacterium norvegicum TaxID=1641715 RepID=A0ABM9AEH6_9GAMM|nr:hypothetical protein SIN8267_01546 [Sinobacterium norvegicum]